MRNILRLIIIAFTGIITTSCAKDIVDLTGDIVGLVKDYDSGQLIENCQVALSPGGKSATTDDNGSFVFEDLEAGTYTLSFSKSGYSEETQEVSVVTGQISRVNVLLKLPSASKGAISGTIKDYASGQLISNCSITISPGGMSKISSASGTYEFSDLTPGEYSLTFSKAGYNDANSSVTVTAGKTTTADVLLKSKSAFAISEDNYDFGDHEVTKIFYFFNNSDENSSFTISNIPEWLSFSKISGAITASGNEAVTATVDRDKVSEGEYSQNVTISFSGKTSGVVSLYIKMKKVVLSAPTVSIAGTAENIQQTSFDISGSITATGGSQITSYGHCWNTTGDPTIDDNKTNLGTPSAIGSFKSTAENLTTYTTYYVRAYAKNAQGISYSDQIAVTTQNVESNIWDGNIATSFEGGSGTSSNPYLIKTGGQLLLMKDYNDKNFKLVGNIDLNNHNWLPFIFLGKLDGDGYTISNLYINRTDDGQGLFSSLYGSVSNLTISGVRISAPDYDYIGAIAGRGEGWSIENCNVRLTSSSSIVGYNYVGGLIGGTGYSSDAISLKNCTMMMDEGASISGDKHVGGIIGLAAYYSIIENCHAQGIIEGGENIGGICGEVHGEELKQCSFSGTVTGESAIGGINGLGYATTIAGCKVQATISSSTGSAGGITGSCICDSRAKVSYISCYSDGTINSSNKSYHTGGIFGYKHDNGSEVKVYLCYSTITSSSNNFCGIATWGNISDSATTHSIISELSSKNSKANCTDITTFLKECYSEYASYWNFNNTWNWEGTIDGSKVVVSCPKLAWED